MANVNRLERRFNDYSSNFMKNIKNSKMPEMIKLAAIYAFPTDLNEISKKQFWIGGIGIRKDGAIVNSRNGAPYCTSTEHYQKQARSHSETRLLRKLGYGGIVYVSRISRRDYSLSMARPCNSCRIFLTSHKIEKVYYSINEKSYGIWYPRKDYDEVISI